MVLQELVLTASLDSTIRVWGVQQTAPCAHVIRAHDGPVTGISLHATGDYLLSCSTDGVSRRRGGQRFISYFVVIRVCLKIVLRNVDIA